MLRFFGLFAKRPSTRLPCFSLMHASVRSPRSVSLVACSNKFVFFPLPQARRSRGQPGASLWAGQRLSMAPPMVVPQSPSPRRLVFGTDRTLRLVRGSPTPSTAPRSIDPRARFVPCTHPPVQYLLLSASSYFRRALQPAQRSEEEVQLAEALRRSVADSLRDLFLQAPSTVHSVRYPPYSCVAASGTNVRRGAAAGGGAAPQRRRNPLRRAAAVAAPAPQTRQPRHPRRWRHHRLR